MGDQVNVAGQWSPYHQIPEVAFSTVPSSNNYFSLVSSGNTPPTTPVFTINQVNNGTIPQNVAGYYLEIDNATISGGGTLSSAFPTYAQGSGVYTITDTTGSMTFYDWVTSYSTAAAMGGSAVPTGPVTLYGFVSSYGGNAEFTALSIVPEPSTVALVGAGLLGLLAVRRRRS